MADHGQVQLVSGPTRCTDNGSASQIDLMFLNDVSVVQSCDVLPPVADHCPTLLQLAVGHTSTPNCCREFWDLSKADLVSLKSVLSEVDWSPVLTSTCPADALSQWESIFLSSVKAFVPHSSVVSRAKNKPWYSSYLCRLRRQRDRLFHRSKRLASGHHLSLAYRKVRNLYVAELRTAERLYYLRQGAKLLIILKYGEELSSLVEIS